MPVEIVAGVELDRAVAEAVGWKHVYDEGNDGIPPDGPYKYKPVPNFSTDLNAAFAAAERVGLFPEDGMRFLRKEADGLWAVVEIYTNTPYEAYIVGSGCTLAFAICAAVLKLKGTDVRQPS